MIDHDLVRQLEEKTQQMRLSMLNTCLNAGTGHVTSSLSCMEILVTLYYGNVLRFDPNNPDDSTRDRFILSKGQASPGLYAVLADLGFYDVEELSRFAQKDGMFGVHLQNSVPGVELTTGSLGHGLGVAAGLALGAKMNRETYMTYCLIGDGECHEGSIWETAQFINHYNLNNLVTILDRNCMCAIDFTENSVEVEPLEEKWASFGFDVERIDGHDVSELLRTLQGPHSRRSRRPLVIICDTIKGNGIDFLSNKPLWHGVTPTKEEDKKRAVEELTRFGGGNQ